MSSDLGQSQAKATICNYPTTLSQIWTVCFMCMVQAMLGSVQCVSLSLPEGARGGGQWGAKRPDMLLMLLHGGNADFEG